MHNLLRSSFIFSVKKKQLCTRNLEEGNFPASREIIFESLLYYRFFMYKPVKIISKMNGKAMTVSEGEFKTKPGELIVATFSNATKQKFYISPKKEDFLIKSVHNNSALDMEGASKNVYSCCLSYKEHGKKNQLWQMVKHEDGCYFIVNSNSTHVLEIEGGIDADGMRVVQNTNYKNLNQLWIIENA